MKSKYFALLLGWLVPGLGHLYTGRRWKAALFFGVITVSALAGLVMGDFRNVYFSARHYQLYAEMGNGLFTLLAGTVFAASGAAPVEHTASGSFLANVLPIADLYLMVAGLLNLVVAANAFDSAARDNRGRGR